MKYTMLLLVLITGCASLTESRPKRFLTVYDYCKQHSGEYKDADQCHHDVLEMRKAVLQKASGPVDDSFVFRNSKTGQTIICSNSRGPFDTDLACK